MIAFGIQNETQLGFGDLLAEADAKNAKRIFQRETTGLPDTIAGGIPFYHGLVEQHHAAMLAADVNGVRALRETARLLARKLNNGEPGILAHEDSPGCVLARETAAPRGTVPLWGQKGDFIIETNSMHVRIEMEGIFGIGSFGHWLGFSAHAVDLDRPFISETGYRSFLGVSIALAEGVTPDRFAVEIVAAFVRREIKGKLTQIEESYRDRMI